MFLANSFLKFNGTNKLLKNDNANIARPTYFTQKSVTPYFSSKMLNNYYIS